MSQAKWETPMSLQKRKVRDLSDNDDDDEEEEVSPPEVLSLACARIEAYGVYRGDAFSYHLRLDIAHILIPSKPLYLAVRSTAFASST